MNSQHYTGYLAQKMLLSLLKLYPQCELAFSKLLFLLIKCLYNNFKKAFPNHWLSFVIPTTQK